MWKADIISKVDKKHDASIFCLQMTHFRLDDTNRLENKKVVAQWYIMDVITKT